MPAAGTFTVVMDPEEVIGGEGESGRLTVRFQGGSDYALFGGDELRVIDKFSRTGNQATAVQSGYELVLPTDVANGGDFNTSLIGYDLVWFTKDATVPALFKARPAGSTWMLSELLNPEPIPTAESAANADRAEAAADEADADRVAAEEAATGATTAATTAAIAAQQAAALIVADLGTSDGQVDALVKSGTARTTLRKQFGTQLSPTDPRFGAVGDGVTDDTTAMLAWLDALIADNTVTNLETTPSFEVAEAWAAVSGSNDPVRSTDRSTAGTYSLKFTRGSGTSATLGRRSTFSALLPSAGTYRISAKAWIGSGIAGTAGLRVVGSGVTTTTGSTATRNAWADVTLTFTWDGTGTVFLDAVDDAVTSGATIYLDQLIITAGSTVVPYFDGNTASSGIYTYSWTGTSGNSTSKRSGGGVAGIIPAGVFRVTASLARRDVASGITIRGAGARQTFLYGDFVGAGQGILDLSDVTRKSGFHRISGIGFLGRGTPGDPVGLLLENSWSNIVEDISAPNITGWGALANSVAVVTNDNNSKFHNIHAQGGWQPKAFDTGTATASITSGSGTVTASSSVFTPGMVGKPIYFASGSDTADNAVWKATITAQTGTTATITPTAPSTATGVRFVVGHVTGSITSGSTSLTIDNAVGLSSAYVGMQVHVLGASAKAGSVNGVLSSRVASVSGNTVTLAAPADATVSNAVVVFAPALFIGRFQGDTSEPQTNHSWWSNVHLEGYAGAGIVVNDALQVVLERLKLHGSSYATGADWGQCYYAGVFSEIKTLTARDLIVSYGILGTRIHVSGSRGMLAFDDTTFSRLMKDVEAIHVATATTEFRLVLGDVFLTYPLTGFASTYDLTSAPYPYSVVSRGTVQSRSSYGTYARTRGGVTSPGATAVNGALTVNDDQVFKWKPPGRFGTLHITSSLAGVVGILHYRTSEQGSGPYCAIVSAGTHVEVISSATTLAGTTGTDGKITVAPDANGFLQFENRRGFNAQIALYHTPYGS